MTINPFVVFIAGMICCFLGGGMLRHAVYTRSFLLGVAGAFVIGLGWRAVTDYSGPVLEAIKAWMQ